MGMNTLDYRGDWSEGQCESEVPVDDKYHVFKLVYDDNDNLDYYLGGKYARIRNNGTSFKN
jgi:hypothetical protein